MNAQGTIDLRRITLHKFIHVVLLTAQRLADPCMSVVSAFMLMSDTSYFMEDKNGFIETVLADFRKLLPPGTVIGNVINESFNEQKNKIEPNNNSNKKTNCHHHVIFIFHFYSIILKQPIFFSNKE
jgi:hypothetical protein